LTCETKEALCQYCEYPYFNMDGSCELSCPITYEQFGNRQCITTASTEEERIIPKVILIMIICTTCLLCFFLGRIGYMWYEDNMDEENEYGSGSFVPVDYEIV